jgi:hypothetical protein
MPVIEAQCASILVPHDHRHINQIRASVASGSIASRRTGQRAWRATPAVPLSDRVAGHEAGPGARSPGSCSSLSPALVMGITLRSAFFA